MNRASTIAIVMLAAAVIIAGCATEPTGQVTSTTSAQSAEPIKLGVTLPLTGEAASLGQDVAAGVDLAVKEINEQGGINGRRIQVIYEDDKCSREGVTTMTKLVTVDEVDGIVGPLCSAAGGPGLPVVAGSGTPAIIYASAPHLTSIGDNIFRIYPNDAFAGRFMAEYAYNVLGQRTAAVVYSQNDWGKGIRDTFVARFTELGGKVVVDEGLPQDARDARTTITKIQAQKPGVIIAPLYPGTAIAFLKQAKDAKLPQTIISGDAWDSDEVVKSGHADGAYLVTAKIGGGEEFKARVREATGKDAGFYTPLGYDAVRIFADVMGRTGSDKQAVRDALASGTFQGVSTSTIEFDENGDLKTAEYNVKVVRDSSAEIIG